MAPPIELRFSPAARKLSAPWQAGPTVRISLPPSTSPANSASAAGLAYAPGQHVSEGVGADQPANAGLSLTGVWLMIPDHALGLPYCARFPCVPCCRHYPGAAAGCIPDRSEPKKQKPYP